MFECVVEPIDVLPHLPDAGSLQRGDGADRDLPFGVGRPDQPHRARVIGDRALRRGGEFAIGLIDQDQIGELDDAALDPLQLVTSRRRQDQDEHVDKLSDSCFGLADADSLDQYRIKSRRFAQQDGLARAARDAAGGVAGGRRADEGLRRARQLGHAGLVAEDRAAAAL